MVSFFSSGLNPGAEVINSSSVSPPGFSPGYYYKQRTTENLFMLRAKPRSRGI